MSSKDNNLKKILRKFWYRFVILNLKIHKKKPEVYSSKYTVDYIIKNGCSVSRFGDGEFKWALGIKQYSFERNSNELSVRLKEILKHPQKKNCIVCVSNVFKGLNSYKTEAERYWEKLIIYHSKEIINLLDLNYHYFDTQFTRPYMDFQKNSKDFLNYFGKVKNIWKNKNIIIVEGEQTRFGVGNDLLENSKSVERIICPSNNAFEIYNKIFKNVKNYAVSKKNTIVLIALGPTASILSFELSDYDIQAIDIGHLDVEYQWFKKSANTKIPLVGKIVNEAGKSFAGEFSADILEKYKKQIVLTID